jgi:hypothetical protein
MGCGDGGRRSVDLSGAAGLRTCRLLVELDQPVTADHVFEIVNLVALASWVLLALSPWLPRAARGVASVATGTAVPVFLAFVYVALIALNWKRARVASRRCAR